MLKKMSMGLVLTVSLGFSLLGCGTATQPAGPTTTDVNNRVDQITKSGIPAFGPAMRGVSDSFDNLYFAAKGGNWALANYMSDVMGDYMAPTQISKPQIYPQWDSFYKTNFGDDSPLKKATAAKDFTALDKAYTNIISSCNTCHAGMGFKFIQKVKASAPEANLDYTVKSNASDNK